MPSHRLLDLPHRRGDLVSCTWRWIKRRIGHGGLGQERSDEFWDGTERESKEENWEHVVII